MLEYRNIVVGNEFLIIELAISVLVVFRDDVFSIYEGFPFMRNHGVQLVRRDIPVSVGVTRFERSLYLDFPTKDRFT